MLIAEDLESEVILLKVAFAKAAVRVPLNFVNDGQEAVEYLEGSGDYADRLAHPFPKILLLDLKMPRLNGFEVLKWVRTRPRLKRLAIVIFSTSAQESDVNRAYDLGVNSYVVKPLSLTQLGELGKVLEEYWYGLNVSGDCGER